MSRLILIALLLLLSMTLVAPVIGQTEDNDEEMSGTATEESRLPANLELLEPETMESTQLGPSTADYVRVVVSLFVVVAIVWALSLLMKRFVTVRGLAGSSENLKVLYTLSLSPTRTLYLVRFADRILLVGAGEGGLRTLAEISDPEEVSSVLQDVEFKGNFDLNPFRKRFNSLLDSGDEEDSSIDKDLGVRHRKLEGIMNRLKNSGEEPGEE